MTLSQEGPNAQPVRYDLLDRVLSRVPDQSLDQQQKVSFTYTQTGQRLSMTDKSGTTNYTVYDYRDRLKTKVTPEGTLNYTYDAHGNVLTINSSTTNGASMTYQYDVLNRLLKKTPDASLNHPAISFTYTPTGQRASMADASPRRRVACGLPVGKS